MEIKESLVIPAQPDAVWCIGGDIDRIAEWVPGLQESHSEGGVRHLRLADGAGEAAERIIERDDRQRYYVYEFMSGPLPLKLYRARFQVFDHPDGAEVVWAAELQAEPPDTEAGIGQSISRLYRTGLAELSRIIAETH